MSGGEGFQRVWTVDKALLIHRRGQFGIRGCRSQQIAKFLPTYQYIVLAVRIYIAYEARANIVKIPPVRNM